jgi:serine/threonine protein kinase
VCSSDLALTLDCAPDSTLIRVIEGDVLVMNITAGSDDETLDDVWMSLSGASLLECMVDGVWVPTRQRCQVPGVVRVFARNAGAPFVLDPSSLFWPFGLSTRVGDVLDWHEPAGLLWTRQEAVRRPDEVPVDLDCECVVVLTPFDTPRWRCLSNDLTSHVISGEAMLDVVVPARRASTRVRIHALSRGNATGLHGTSFRVNGARLSTYQVVTETVRGLALPPGNTPSNLADLILDPGAVYDVTMVDFASTRLRLDVQGDAPTLEPALDADIVVATVPCDGQGDSEVQVTAGSVLTLTGGTGCGGDTIVVDAGTATFFPVTTGTHAGSLLVRPAAAPFSVESTAAIGGVGAEAPTVAAFPLLRSSDDTVVGTVVVRRPNLPLPPLVYPLNLNGNETTDIVSGPGAEAILVVLPLEGGSAQVSLTLADGLVGVDERGGRDTSVLLATGGTTSATRVRAPLCAGLYHVVRGDDDSVVVEWQVNESLPDAGCGGGGGGADAEFFLSVDGPSSIALYSDASFATLVDDVGLLPADYLGKATHTVACAGPIIPVRRGDSVRLTVRNTLPSTAIHLTFPGLTFDSTDAVVAAASTVSFDAVVPSSSAVASRAAREGSPFYFGGPPSDTAHLWTVSPGADSLHGVLLVLPQEPRDFFAVYARLFVSPRSGCSLTLADPVPQGATLRWFLSSPPGAGSSSLTVGGTTVNYRMQFGPRLLAPPSSVSVGDSSLTQFSSGTSRVTVCPSTNPTSLVVLNFTMNARPPPTLDNPEVRLIDGTGISKLHLHWGHAHRPFIRRWVDANLTGDELITRGPDPIALSRALFSAQPQVQERLDPPLSSYMAAFAAFLAVDLSVVPRNPESITALAVPTCDPWFDVGCEGNRTVDFFRTTVSSDVLVDQGLETRSHLPHPDDATTYCDASQVYGSTVAQAQALRTLEGGQLRVGEDALAASPMANAVLPAVLVYGLFVDEHNRYAAARAALAPNATDEDLYQSARQHVIGVLQKVVANDWLVALTGGALPSLLQEDEVMSSEDGGDDGSSGGASSGDDGTGDTTASDDVSENVATRRYFADAQPDIDVTFASVCMPALIASQLATSIPIVRDLAFPEEGGDTVSLADCSGSAAAAYGCIRGAGGTSVLLKGMLVEKAQAVDLSLSPHSLAALAATEGDNLDLATALVQRTRDMGVPRYAALREAMGLAVPTTFEQVAGEGNNETATLLAGLYDGDVLAVDAIVGLLLEKPVTGSAVGETLSTCIIEQMARTRAADRLWFENNLFSREPFQAIVETSLATLLRRSAAEDDAWQQHERDSLPPNVFFAIGDNDDDDVGVFPVPPRDRYPLTEQLAPDLLMAYGVSEDRERLAVWLARVGPGYMSIGVGAEPGTMRGGDMVIGWVDEGDGTAYAVDVYGVRGLGLPTRDADLGGSSSTSNVAGRIEGVFHIVEFERPFAADDEVYDHPIVTSDALQEIIWALGPLSADAVAGASLLYHGPAERGRKHVAFGQALLLDAPRQPVDDDVPTDVIIAIVVAVVVCLGLVTGLLVYALRLRYERQVVELDEDLPDEDRPMLPPSSRLAVKEDWLLSVEPQSIRFGTGEKGASKIVPTNEVVFDTLTVRNTTTRSVTVEVLYPVRSPKLRLVVEPRSFRLGGGKDATITVRARFLCTTKVKVPIFLSVDGVDEHIAVNCKAETELSVALDFDEFELYQKVGEGSFGAVYEGMWRKQRVAIKLLKYAQEAGAVDLDEFRSEIAVLAKLRHQNIVRFTGACFFPKRMALVTEFSTFGSLHRVMRSHSLPWALTVRMLGDIAAGVAFLHESGIVHRDLKTDNVLVFSLSESETVLAKLTDFGTAVDAVVMVGGAKGKNQSSLVGTPIYMAPELLLRSAKPSEETDVYAFGIMMYELAAELEPFADIPYMFDLAPAVTSGRRPTWPDMVTETAPTGYVALTESCWHQEPSQRPNITSVLASIDAILDDLGVEVRNNSTLSTSRLELGEDGLPSESTTTTAGEGDVEMTEIPRATIVSGAGSGSSSSSFTSTVNHRGESSGSSSIFSINARAGSVVDGGAKVLKLQVQRAPKEMRGSARRRMTEKEEADAGVESVSLSPPPSRSVTMPSKQSSVSKRKKRLSMDPGDIRDRGTLRDVPAIQEPVPE